MRDQRIFDAVLAVADAPDGAPLIRLSALRVLVNYTNPVVDVSLDDLEHPKDNESCGLHRPCLTATRAKSILGQPCAG